MICPANQAVLRHLRQHGVLAAGQVDTPLEERRGLTPTGFLTAGLTDGIESCAVPWWKVCNEKRQAVLALLIKRMQVV
jgi:hypothetical protein